MAGLPTKYARMGFAKGWRAFKASRSSARTSGGGGKVARKKSKRGFRRAKSAGGGFSAMDALLYGAGYGVVQPKAYELAAKTGLNPRLLLGGAGYLAATQGSGMIKKAGLVILTREAGSQAQSMTAGMLSASATSGTSTYL